MRPFAVSLLATLALGAPAFVAASALTGPAFAQQAAPAQGGEQAEPPQVALTEAEIQNFLGAAPEIAAVMAKVPPGAEDKPDAKIMAALDAAAKKHGFANFQEFSVVSGNISLVMDGVDPSTKTYVGAATMLKRQMAEIQADKKMSAKDKKAAMADLASEMESTPPLKFQANVAIVIKNIDAIVAAMPQEGGPPQ
jgi:hypothetical protein